MSETSSLTLRSKILDYLRKVAPYSIVERGIGTADAGHVVESSRHGSRISSVVKDENDTTYTVQLDILSPSVVDATCTCCDRELMAEQWCHHAVAVLWRARELDFFQSDGGFASREASLRISPSSPQDIALAIEEIVHSTDVVTPTYLPAESSIGLDCSSDRLGVQVKIAGQVRGPILFDGFSGRKERALDRILIELLEDWAQWDEQSELWYVSSSEEIQRLLGLIQEYADVRILPSQERLEFEDHLLDARLLLEWTPSGAEVSMEWVLPTGEQRARENELIGTGPYWTLLDNVLYKLSPIAARIASLFQHPGRLSFSRTQVGPMLEVLSSVESGSATRFLKVRRSELQPEAEVRTPIPTLDLSMRSISSEHFASGGTIEISAVLDFEYPSPKPEDNVVYLPDREKEHHSQESLRSLGFRYVPERRIWVVTGDDSVDIVDKGRECFPADWKVAGVSALKKAVRFAQLSVELSLSSANAAEAGEGGWFDCSVSLFQNNARVPLSSLFKHARPESERWIRLDSGAYAKVPGGGLSLLKTTLGMLDPNFKLSNTLRVRLSSAQALGLSAVEDNQFQISADPNLKALRSRLRDFKELSAIRASKNFEGKLRSYQEEGISWLKFLSDFELGGILADEMGLGKTVQALSFLQVTRESRKTDKNLKKPVLIIAPTSVMTNWAYEVKRFTPTLTSLLLHGPGRKRLFSQIPEHDLVITSYALLRLDRLELARYEFSYLILDEAQNIKNPLTATTKAAKAIHARRRLALTGTPTENRPMELWSIMDFLMPGYLGSYEFFRNYIEKPILEGGPGVEVAKFLKTKTRPFILRRTKDEVERDLPPKIESVVHVEMAPSQRDLYTQILQEVRPKVFDAVAKKGIRGASVSILAALLRLRQVCNHPNSISALRELEGYESGKFSVLQDIVQEALESGRKILVFSQFREMLKIMKNWLEGERIQYLYLDGLTKSRQTIIDRFNSDESVRLFLVSLKAGGTGLNLHSADTVIIYDPWWNPAVESQAVDRAHRIGQTRKVNVYRLVTENSVEQKIMDLKERKAKIVDALINENGLSTLKLSKADLEALFAVPAPDAV
jgi:superfamily II DNA or RNA helicase